MYPNDSNSIQSIAQKIEKRYNKQFYALPKLLMQDKSYKKLNNNEKVLYAMLLSKIRLSFHKGYVDEDGYCFCYFKLEEITKVLNVSINTASRYLKKLEQFSLVKRVHQGAQKPNKIYLYDVYSATKYNRQDKEFIHYTVLEDGTLSFLRIPSCLFEMEETKKLTTTAKILYSLLLERLEYSIRNNYKDVFNRYYVVFHTDELKEQLNLAKTTINKALKELYDLDENLVELNYTINMFRRSIYVMDIFSTKYFQNFCLAKAKEKLEKEKKQTTIDTVINVKTYIKKETEADFFSPITVGKKEEKEAVEKKMFCVLPKIKEKVVHVKKEVETKTKQIITQTVKKQKKVFAIAKDYQASFFSKSDSPFLKSDSPFLTLNRDRVISRIIKKKVVTKYLDNYPEIIFSVTQEPILINPSC